MFYPYRAPVLRIIGHSRKLALTRQKFPLINTRRNGQSFFHNFHFQEDVIINYSIKDKFGKTVLIPKLKFQQHRDYVSIDGKRINENITHLWANKYTTFIHPYIALEVHTNETVRKTRTHERNSSGVWSSKMIQFLMSTFTHSVVNREFMYPHSQPI